MPYQVNAINPTKTTFIIVDRENDFVAEGAPLRATMAPAVVPPVKRALAHAAPPCSRGASRAPNGFPPSGAHS